jgi:hypothetical protein
MSLTAQQLAQLDSLLSDLGDERLDADGRLALEELLKSEPEARDHYIRFMALCSDLHDAAAMTLSAQDAESANEKTADVTPFLRGVDADRGVKAASSLGRWWPVWPVSGAIAVALAIVAGLTWWPPSQDEDSSPHSAPIVGRLEERSGAVAVDGQDLGAPGGIGREILSGQEVSTRGPDAHAAIRLSDGSVLALSGDTRLAFPKDDTDRIDVKRGNLVADVEPRPAEQPLVIRTPEAIVQVLGTRLSVSREPKRTLVAVIEGEIRITRLSDQREISLEPGQATKVSPETDLRPTPIQAVPDHWSLDFNEGLPRGWQTGQLVFDDLPEGSRAVVRTSEVMEKGRRRYQIRSHNAWSDGLFSLHDDSWLHIRYRVEKPGTFLLYVVCRQHDFGQPVATLLSPGNLRQNEPKQWHTLTLRLNQLKRTKTEDSVSLDGQLVAFKLVFDSPEPDPRLTIDRIWVTRGVPAEPRSPMDLNEAQPEGAVD